MRYNGAKYCFTIDEAMESLKMDASYNSDSEKRRFKEIPDDFKREWIEKYVESAEVCSWCNTITHSPSHWPHVCEAHAKKEGGVKNVMYYKRSHSFQLLKAWGSRCDYCGEADAQDYEDLCLCDKHKKVYQVRLRDYRKRVTEAKETYKKEIWKYEIKLEESLESAKQYRELVETEFIASAVKYQSRQVI